MSPLPRLVLYSLSLSEGPSRLPRAMQLLESLRSLRRHNRELPVLLQLAGQLSPDEAKSLGPTLDALDVRVVLLGDYAGLIDAALPGASAQLRHYPVLHKLLGLAGSLGTGPDALDPEQLLYLDNDSYFHRDPAALLDACRDADLYAREEPFSRRSHLAPLPDYFDEDALMALQTGAPSPMRPFNTGVMIWNHGLTRRLLPLAQDYLISVLGFSRWIVEQGLPPGQCPDLDLLAREPALQALWPDLLPMPYPSRNLWIREQMALWLSLSKLPGLRQGWLNPEHVLQGCEEIQFRGRFARPVISHYFSQNSQAFFASLEQNVYADTNQPGS